MELVETLGQPSFASRQIGIPSSSSIIVEELSPELKADPKDKEIATLKAKLDDLTRKFSVLLQDYAAMNINVFSEQNMPGDVLQMYTGLERKVCNILCKHIEKFQPISYYTSKQGTSMSLKDQILLCLTLNSSKTQLI